MGRLKTPRSPLKPAPSTMPQPLRRGSARERGYDALWDKESRAFRRANPYCLGCAAVGLLEATTVTDHTVPHRQERRLLRDPKNRQPSCDWHHNVVKPILERRYEAGELLPEDLRLDSAEAIALTRELLPARKA